MITAKFGGTAITPYNLKYVKQIVGPKHNFVVVSAMGVWQECNGKVTDLLDAYFITENADIWQRICKNYQALVAVNGVDVDIDKLLADAKRRTHMHSRQYCLSLGEELSAKVVAKFLGATYVEAQQTIVFDRRGNVDMIATKQNLAKYKGQFCVMGGFYGGWANTRKVFGRGGGDVSGAVVAVLTDSELYQNWTDVKGVHVADPQVMPNAPILQNVSYTQMYQMAGYGAKVLHKDAILPLQQAKLPLWVGHFACPFGQGTTVHIQPNCNDVFCIAQQYADQIYTTTVMHNLPTAQMANLLCNFIHQKGICPNFMQIDASKGVICTPNSIVCDLCNSLQSHLPQ